MHFAIAVHVDVLASHGARASADNRKYIITHVLFKFALPFNVPNYIFANKARFLQLAIEVELNHSHKILNVDKPMYLGLLGNAKSNII